MSLLRLSRREDWWKDAEILMLRHQLAVALRERPRAAAGLTWPDRAWLALMGAETLRHQAIFVNHAPGTIPPLDPELIQIRDAVGQSP